MSGGGDVGARARGWASGRRAHPFRRVGVSRGTGHRTLSEGDGFETRAIHTGQAPDGHTGAIVPPITLATTFAQDAVGKHRGYEYARSDNPTRHALEICVASLEGAGNGL